MQTNRSLSTKIIERLPQAVHLRSGLMIELRDRHDTGEFWHVFSSSEYLALLPELIALRPCPELLVDCGTGIGLFTLLIEHLCRAEVLPWGEVDVVAVEGGSFNHRQAERNLRQNLAAERFVLHLGLVGKKHGEAEFFESSVARWSSGTSARPGLRQRAVRRPFVDLTPMLMAGRSTLVKMDIEGAEFEAIAEYAEVWSQVTALIIEWHAELGDVDAARAVLTAAGLEQRKRSWHQGNRIVELYVRGS